MSDIVLARGGKVSLLQQQITYLNTLECHLFTNDQTPDDSMTAADFDECTDALYDPVTGVGFGAAALNGAYKGETVGTLQIWQFDHAGGDFWIYGCYFTDPNDSDVLKFSQRADTPLHVTSAGQLFAVTPRMQLDTM